MPDLTLIDTHVHLWDPAHLAYPWLADLPLLNERHDLPAFDAARGEVEVERLVFVECTGSFDDAVARREVEWVEGLAAHDPRIRGLVAHASLEHGAAAREHLDWLAGRPLVKGVRRLLQGEPDPAFCLRPAFVEGVQMLADVGLSFDVCIYHPQLPSVIELVQQCPQVTFVLDHIGKPAIREGRLDPWRQHLRELAALPNVVCKISGVVTEADHAHWTPDEVRPYLEHALSVFGEDRVLFGSDWPVLRLAGAYPAWVHLVRDVVHEASEDARAKLFRTNAERVYRLG